MGSYGFRGQIGFGEEVTWGTPVAPAKFMEFKSETIKKTITEYVSAGIRTTPNQVKSQRMQGKTDIGGDVLMDAYLMGQGLLWKHLLGSVADAVQGTTAYLHTFTCADDLPAGLTAEIERDAKAFTYSGLRIASLKLKQPEDGPADLTWSFKGKGETLAASPAVATYPVSNKLIGINLTTVMTIGGTTVNPSAFDLTIANKLDDTCYGFNQARYALPFMGRDVTGSMTVDFNDDVIYNMFVSGTPAIIQFQYTGAIINTTYSEQLTINLPVAYFNGDTPTIGGKQNRINLVLPFRAFADGTNKPVQVTLQNIETTV